MIFFGMENVFWKMETICQGWKIYLQRFLPPPLHFPSPHPTKVSFKTFTSGRDTLISVLVVLSLILKKIAKCKTDYEYRR